MSDSKFHHRTKCVELRLNESEYQQRSIDDVHSKLSFVFDFSTCSRSPRRVTTPLLELRAPQFDKRSRKRTSEQCSSSLATYKQTSILTPSSKNTVTKLS
ncbi:hypothetical protein TNCV_2223581 [Trichonephila clavipes]|nr:hypothetical protein TNCV_2223581 [Trichonephila clavipes]